MRAAPLATRLGQPQAVPGGHGPVPSAGPAPLDAGARRRLVGSYFVPAAMAPLGREMASKAARYIAEFVGTFGLVFVGTATTVLAQYFGLSLGELWILVAFAFGLTLVVMLYAMGGVSGGHFNPAVTVAMRLARRMERGDFVPYVLSQLLGGIVASVALYGLVAGLPGYEVSLFGLGANGSNLAVPAFTLLLSEVLLTMLFLVVILGVTHEGRLPAGIAPLPIGLTLLAAHFVGVPLAGSSLNPARSTGPAIFQGLLGGPAQAIVLTSLWIFWVGPIVGAVIGFAVYWILWAPERT